MANIDYKLSASQAMVEQSGAPTLKTQRGWQYILETLQTLVGAPGEEQDDDLATIAALTPADDDILQRKAGAWTNRTMAQLAADLPLAAAGWTQIATSTPTGVNAVTFSSIPQTYGDLLLVCAGISCATATRAPGLSFSTNGTTFSTIRYLCDTLTASETARGAILIPGYRLGDGVLVSGLNKNNTTSPGFESGEFGYDLPWRADGGITAVRMSWTSGSNFDAGTLTLYGK